MKHLVNLIGLTRADILGLFRRAAQLKAECARGLFRPLLQGRMLALIFEKPSLRTRVSFETAMAHLGGSSLFLTDKEVGMGTRESMADISRTMSQYVDAIVLRTFEHKTIELFAEQSGVPVINGLSDYNHPCQALADLFTVHEHCRTLSGRTLVFVGDGNNVARSVAVCSAKLGMRFILACPREHGFKDDFHALLRSEVPDAEFTAMTDARKAVRDADIIYTDVWTSMGQENERAERRKRFVPYQVNAELLALAPKHALVMHCLPANRGEEITAEVIDGPQSIVFQQAGNRLHIQKSLLLWLLGQGSEKTPRIGSTAKERKRQPARDGRRRSRK